MISLLRDKVVNFKLFTKQIIMVTVDVVLLICASFFSFSIRLNELYFINEFKYFLIYLIPLVSIPIFIRYNLYREKIRFIGINFLLQIFKAVAFYSLLWGFIIILIGLDLLPRSVIVIQWILALIFITISKFLAQNFLYSSSTNRSQRILNSENILIYGAGSAGIQLASSIQYNDNYNLVGFIDDNKKIINQRINGVDVYSVKAIEKLKTRHKLNQIFIAMPSLNKKRKEIIINRVNKYDLIIKTVPGLNQLTEKNFKIDDLKVLNIEDLLGREEIFPDQKLMQKNITNKKIIVTGAGGSIGSQICKEIIKYNPNLLILYEINEFALFQIYNQLSNLENIKIEAILGDVKNQKLIENICRKNQINTVYHTAAYKHVPMIENNIIEGVSNNILGLYNCLTAAVISDVNNFVLISTDKAVRPTNVMGATKRISEMILQNMANSDRLHKKKINTKLSAVRFGNVLGSSGSVVPLFNNQIKNGGPITITHKDIIRYFMTIKEASQLVIQAGAIGGNGEIFLLDMGEPVKIIDLAKKMIHLSGLEVQDYDNPEGDIEIIETNLRQGEKLYEELLIDGNSEKTDHPRIFRANEKIRSWKNLDNTINQFKSAIDLFDEKEVLDLLKKCVPEYIIESK